jgi:hypothetical protein
MTKILCKNKFLDIDLESRPNKYTPLSAACLGRNY